MERINMKNKFFHAPKWDENFSKQINTLTKIINCGYIGFDDKSTTYLSVHPNGDYIQIYPGNGFAKDSAFDMTRNTFFFILSSQLKDDFSITPGHYPHEALINTRISLNKYLIGIGNVGCNISYHLSSCYYLTRFICQEIDSNETLKELSYIFSPISNILSPDRLDDIEKDILCPDTDLNTLDIAFTSKPETLIKRKDIYHKIKEALERIQYITTLYDLTGLPVDYAKQMQRIKNMQEYIKTNNFSERTYCEALDELRHIAQKR